MGLTAKVYGVYVPVFEFESEAGFRRDLVMDLLTGSGKPT